jgi:predicted nucleic acid-binding protein
VLLALTTLNRLGLLRDLFQQVMVPPMVSIEVSRRVVNVTRDSLGLHQGELKAIVLVLDVHASLLILDDLQARRLNTAFLT